MKNIILIFFFLLSFSKLSAQDFWQKLNSPSNLQLTDVIVNKQGNIFISCWDNQNDGGIYRSDDEGATWSVKNNGFLAPNQSILSLATNSYGTLFAGAQNGILKSSDNGDTWMQVYQSPIYAANVYVIRCGYDSIILAGGENADGIIRSGDYGMTWQKVFDISHNGWFESITDIQFDPIGVIYACSNTMLTTNTGKIYVSDDLGVSWHEFGNAWNPSALGFDKSGHLLRVEDFWGLFRYDVSSSNWENILNNCSPHSILTVPDGKIFLACGYISATNGGVMVSDDNGNSFQYINSGFIYDMNDAGNLTKDNIGRILVLNLGLYRSYDTIFNSVKKINVEDNQLLAYPNPFHEKILIEFHGTNISTPEAFILIYNSTGQLIHQAIINCKEEYCWDAATFPTGVYLIKFYNGKSTSTIKVIHY